jgi:hypothetical protein
MEERAQAPEAESPISQLGASMDSRLQHLDQASLKSGLLQRSGSGHACSSSGRRKREIPWLLLPSLWMPRKTYDSHYDTVTPVGTISPRVGDGVGCYWSGELAPRQGVNKQYIR